MQLRDGVVLIGASAAAVTSAKRTNQVSNVSVLVPFRQPVSICCASHDGDVVARSFPRRREVKSA